MKQHRERVSVPLDESNVVEVVSVSRRVGEVDVLAPTSFAVPAGCVTVVTGPNGSGKTTLLRLILGRDSPTSGSVRLARAATAHRPGTASLTDVAPLYRDLTVLEHLQLVQASWGGAIVAGDFRRVIEVLAMGGILRQFPAELSSGERQLVGLACALFRPSALLVLDEPEQRLDARRRSAVGELILEKKRLGTSIVLATHEMMLSERVADHSVRLGAPE